MAGSVRPVVDERDGLLAYLAQQREMLRLTAHGLTDEQASQKPSASSLSIAGLIKHCLYTERGWIVGTMMQQETEDRDYEADFSLSEGETLADVLARWDEVAAETESIVNALPDLDYPVPVPEAPWFPDDVEFWSARWVLLHLIEEIARHAGHADIVRESLDGKTWYELMAAAEA